LSRRLVGKAISKSLNNGDGGKGKRTTHDGRGIGYVLLPTGTNMNEVKKIDENRKPKKDHTRVKRLPVYY